MPLDRMPAVAQDPAGNLKPAKDKSSERIDGILATIVAIGRAMVARGGVLHVLCLSEAAGVRELRPKLEFA
jgi:hypothetical protein